MNLNLLFENLSNPALLFFVLGIIAVALKSDLEIPPNSSKFISLYLMFAIGFKGGQELVHEKFTLEILVCVFIGLLSSIIIPFYSFFILKRKLSIYDSVAIAACYGSISAVTFISAVNYLEFKSLLIHGHMIAVMALMEVPSIIIGLILLNKYSVNKTSKSNNKNIIKHSLTNGSVILILGSLIIGFLASESHAQGIKPFTTDLFKGFLAIFLLDMGISSGKKLKSFFSYGYFPIIFAIMIPLINGSIFAFTSSLFIDDISNRFIISILAASASYIAVPAAMKISVPESDPGLYLPMALAVTFPINLTLGFPLYYAIASLT